MSPPDYYAAVTEAQARRLEAEAREHTKESAMEHGHLEPPFVQIAGTSKGIFALDAIGQVWEYHPPERREDVTSSGKRVEVIRDGGWLPLETQRWCDHTPLDLL